MDKLKRRPFLKKVMRKNKKCTSGVPMNCQNKKPEQKINMEMLLKTTLIIARTFLVWCWVPPWPRGRHPQTWSPRLFSAVRRTWAKVSMLGTNLPVFRIPDILMRIRTNGSGSCSFLSEDGNKKINFFPKFFCLLLFENTFTSFFNNRIKVFLTILLDDVRIRIRTPDWGIRMAQNLKDPEQCNCIYKYKHIQSCLYRKQNAMAWCLEVLPFEERKNNIVTTGNSPRKMA